ncbi:MAG: primosomal protein N' [Candidatus Babeliaceae bacterium]|nr:primosomal protein N' [Candidatus Babeliaceae bacterium]
MHITVKLLNGFQQQLTYKVPASWTSKPRISDIISVPLQKRKELAYITHILEHYDSSQEHFKIKEAFEQQPLPDDGTYKLFIQQLARYYCVSELSFYKRFAQYLEDAHDTRDIMQLGEISRESNLILSPAQQHVAQEIDLIFEKKEFQPILLHGVTGSGKTEIYKHAAQKAIVQGNNVLLLLPEVSLAVRFTQIFKNYFNDSTPVFSFHSATSKTEKKALWQHMYTNNAAIIIGVHLPLLLPIPRLGCIIIDEEHDVGYQEKKIPRIHTKEAALMRASLMKIPILLGSATPSISSLYNVEHKGWKLLKLNERFRGAFPKIEIVQLDKKNKSNFWISKELQAAILDRLKRKEQTIIFLNRRGYSFFVQCFACDYIFNCLTCSVSLTFHEPNILTCHYCGIKKMVPVACPTCNQPEKQFLKKGIGTQQVVTLLQKLYPQAVIARADLDSTVNKKKWQQIVDDMHTQKIDILVGTQTITKGYHFPQVTLVGILWADSNIHFPFYAAAETTLSQLIQVAGRAGRETENGLVIMQTITQHPIFSYINEEHYIKFYEYERAYRQELRYPPYVRFAEIEFRHEHEQTVARDALICAEFLENLSYKQKKDLVVLGPAQPMVHKIQNIFIQKVYIKSESIKEIISAYRAMAQLPISSKHFFTPNPVS